MIINTAVVNMYLLYSLFQHHNQINTTKQTEQNNVKDVY